MKKEVKLLHKKAINSLVLSIKTNSIGRPTLEGSIQVSFFRITHSKCCLRRSFSIEAGKSGSREPNKLSDLMHQYVRAYQTHG